MIFDKLRATTSRAIRQSKPKAILRLECPTPHIRKVYTVLFTTTRMDAMMMWKHQRR